MTDRINALTVVLINDIREDDAKHIVDAILMIKGVLSVTANVADLDDTLARIRARDELTTKIYAALNCDQINK